MYWPFGAAECCQTTGTTEEKTETQEGWPLTRGSDELAELVLVPGTRAPEPGLFPFLEAPSCECSSEASLRVTTICRNNKRQVCLGM